MTKQILLECDDLDYDAIQNAISRRQLRRIMPDGEGNMAVRVIAVAAGWNYSTVDRRWPSERR